MRKKVVFCGLVILLLILIGSHIIRTNPKAAIYVQNALGASGPSFVIGSAKISIKPDWLLVSSREKTGDRLKLYGLLPIPESFSKNPSPSDGRFFAFSDVSESEKIEFAFMEVESHYNERMKAWINGTLIPEEGLNNCRIEKEVIAGASAVECSIAGGWVAFVPEFEMSLVMHSKNPNLRPYLTLAVNSAK